MRPLIRLALLACCWCAPADAETFPARPINVIVPFAPGGSVDAVARIIGDAMGQSLGQRLVIENAGGAGGTVAAARGARATPDGYTLVAGSSGTHAVAYSFYDKLAYGPDTVSTVGLMAIIPSLIVVRKDLGVSNLAELIALAKARPGALSVGHPGIGSHVHLACESFKRETGIDVKLVPYRGAGPVMTDLVAGQIDVACDATPSTTAPHGAGLVRALAVLDRARASTLPGVGTVGEQGWPALVAPTWVALFAPAGTPSNILETLSRALSDALARPEIRERLEQLGVSVPEEARTRPGPATDFVRSEVERWRGLASEARPERTP